MLVPAPGLSPREAGGARRSSGAVEVGSDGWLRQNRLVRWRVDGKGERGFVHLRGWKPGLVQWNDELDEDSKRGQQGSALKEDGGSRKMLQSGKCCYGCLHCGRPESHPAPKSILVVEIHRDRGDAVKDLEGDRLGQERGPRPVQFKFQLLA
jgi:hypothetical protein